MTTIIDKTAWAHLDQKKNLSTRSRGKDVYYILGGKSEPGEYIPGGKREPGETDLDMLVREIDCSTIYAGQPTALIEQTAVCRLS
jgi:8-oxo-dGTP diphosphatase